MKKLTTALNNWRICLLTLFVLLLFQSPLSAEEMATPLTGKIFVCEGEIATYTYPYTNGNNYVWSASGGTGVAVIDNVNDLATFTVEWGLASNSFPKVIFHEYSNGVLITNLTLDITISGIPNPQIISNFNSECPQDSSTKGRGSKCETVCEFSDVIYTTPHKNGNSYSWTIIGNTTDISGANTNTTTVSWGAPGQAFVIVTESNAAGCIGTDTICVEIVDRPIGGFKVEYGGTGYSSSPTSNNASAIEICKNGTICFNDASTGASAWFWDFGNGHTSSLQNPCETFSQSGGYLVTQIVENECHCRDTSFIWVKVRDEVGPEIVCASVVCGSGKFTYNAILPKPCNGGYYQWNISNNGTIVLANGMVNTMTSQSVTGTDVTSIDIYWNSGPNGTISLSIAGCSGLCDQTATVTIPIIPNTIDIEGSEVVCQGDAAKLKVPCYPGTKYKWFVNNNPTYMTGSEFEQHFWAPGTYEIKVTYENDFLDCSGLSNIFTLTVLPKLTIYGDKKICEGETASFNGPNGASLFWELKAQDGTVVNSSGNSDNYTTTATLAPGTYTIIATDKASPRDFCNDYAIYSLRVIGQPAAPTTINGPTKVCIGEASIYTAQPTSNDYLLEWEIDNNGVISTINGNVATVSWASGNKSLSLYQVTKVKGCRSAAYTIPITDKTPPSITITGPTPVCGNTDASSPISYQTTASLDGYEWSIVPDIAGSIVYGEGTNSIDVIWNNYNGTANIILTPTICNTSFSPKSYPVDIVTPSMTINGPDTICQNDIGSWTATFDFGSGTNFSWEIEAVNGGTIVANGSGNIANYNFPDSSGSFIVRIKAANCMHHYTEIKNIVVNPAPVANLSYTGYIGCIDQNMATIILSTQGTASNYSYKWYHKNILINPQPSGSSYTIGNSAADSGSYYVVITDINTTCTSTTNIILASICSIVPPPNCTAIESVVNFTYSIGSTSPTPGCNKVDFQGSVSKTPVSVYWRFAGLGTATVLNPSFQFPSSGVYRVEMIAIYGYDTCSVSKIHTVVIPVISDFEVNISCIGNSFQVNLINTSDVVLKPLSSFTHKWKIYDLSNSNALVASSNSQDYLNVPNLVGGNSYKITLQETNSFGWGGQSINANCTYQDTIIIPVKAAADFIMSNSTPCIGDTVTFTDQSLGNIYEWNWQFGDGSSILTQNPKRTYQNTPNSYDVKLTVVDEYGCTDNITKTVEVKQNNIDGNISVSPTMPICPGTTATLTFNNTTSPSSAPYQYLWSDNTSGPINSNIGQTSTHYLVVTDKYHCSNKFGPETVEIVNMPSGIINGKTDYCYGEKIQLSANYGSAFDYKWEKKISPSTIFVNAYSTSTSLAINYIPIGTHEFRVTITDPVNNCTVISPIFTVNVHANPQSPTISTNPTPACLYNPVQLTVTNPLNYQSIAWSTGDVAASTTAYTSGIYSAEGTDINGCKSSRETKVFDLPDFCGFMCGCYEDCIEKGDTFFFPGIQGNFALWRWEKLDGHNNWVTVTSGSGTVDDYIVTTASSETIRLYVKTYNGCDGYSCEADLDITICIDPCKGRVNMKRIDCREGKDGNVEYFFMLDVYFENVGTKCDSYTYDIIPSSGSIDPNLLNPHTIIHPNHNNEITGVWNTGGTYFPGGGVCFDIEISNKCDDPCGENTCVFHYCFKVEKCGKPNGIDEKEKDKEEQNSSISFYPNPTNGSINMESTTAGNYDVKIYSIQGKVVYSQQLSFLKTESRKLKLDGLNSGIYIIKCISDNETISKRLVIE